MHSPVKKKVNKHPTADVYDEFDEDDSQDIAARAKKKKPRKRQKNPKKIVLAKIIPDQKNKAEVSQVLKQAMNLKTPKPTKKNVNKQLIDVMRRPPPKNIETDQQIVSNITPGTWPMSSLHIVNNQLSNFQKCKGNNCFY